MSVSFQGQHEKIMANEFLASTIKIILTVGADEKEREMVCLPLKYIYGWLFTINPGKVAPEARESVERYCVECYEVLYDHFAGAARRQQEQNAAEKDILDRKAAALESISRHKKAISDENSLLKEYDAQLARIQEQRLNPQPSLFD